MSSEYDLQLFKTIFDQSPVSTQIFTPDGETWLVNKAWEKLWQVKFSQLGSYNILKDKQLIETKVMPYIERGFKGEILTLPPNKYEPAKTINVKGAVAQKWVSAQMYPIRGAKNKILFIVLQHEDITERRQAEVVNSRLAAIVESSDDAIISKGLDGVINSWNVSAEKMFGHTAEDAIGRHISLIIPAEHITEEEQIISQIKQGKRVDHFETVRVRKDGTYINVSLTISPVKDGSGKIVGASKIARDITKHIQSERTLKESEERLRIALNAGEIGVWDWNLKNNALSWTDKVYKIHGVTKKTFIPTFDSFTALIHPEDKKRVAVDLQQSLDSKHEFVAEFRIVTPSEETRWVSTRALVTYDKHEKPVRMLGATSDITRQKLLDQEKSDFLSMASHELKTPLTSMKMFVDLLERELNKQTEEKPKYLAKRIKDQTTRLTELTNDLLDVSRIETGKLQLNLETFNLVALVKDTVEGIQTSAQHELLIKDNGSLIVRADSYRIYQVLVNLLTNAIKYSGKGKKIIITISQKEEAAIVSVRDYGIGIAKSKQKQIFERLYQVTDPEEKTFPGLGLGLYITREIISRHNGRIWVNSEKGKGSTFYFSIPINIFEK